jgi:hypothetical protein
MGPRDLIVTPLFLILIYVSAYFARYLVTDRTVRKYFLPALTLKIFGAISLGLIYQYYYKGGDTFVYFDHGSRYIWEAFLDSPFKAFKLIFAKGEYLPETWEYASNIIFYDDLPSYFVVRIAGFFDIFTFHTYSATASLFAVAGFSGLWAMYTAFYRMFPKITPGNCHCHILYSIRIFLGFRHTERFYNTWRIGMGYFCLLHPVYPEEKDSTFPGDSGAIFPDNLRN